jgi:histone H3/H4
VFKKLKLKLLKRKRGGVKMALVVKSAVRKQMKNMRASSDFFKALDKCVACCISEAMGRAKSNGRKTVRGYDL